MSATMTAPETKSCTVAESLSLGEMGRSDLIRNLNGFYQAAKERMERHFEELKAEGFSDKIFEEFHISYRAITSLSIWMSQPEEQLSALREIFNAALNFPYKGRC